ncbi:MAG: hypothetical protein CV087_08865 [Candidatus Brocadia sp. WS118]|nr:MAG: hypothetical protein CV087_08865 [Candidatus Brocadia sp. WS118]
MKCVICSVDLKPLELDDNDQPIKLNCPACKRDYFPRSQMLDNADDVSATFDEYPDIELAGISVIDGNVSILASDDEFEPDADGEEHKKKGGFYSMDYIKKMGWTIEEIHEEF